MTHTPNAVPGAKIVYLIKRKPASSREELIAHWFANHMPRIIADQKRAADNNQPHASRYIATLFDPDKNGQHPWDGMAQLWLDAPLEKPDPPQGTVPKDTFQQKAEPYLPWATTEYIAMDGQLPVEPLTLNAPFPCTRSGFYKKCFLVSAVPGTDHDQFFKHWREVHLPNVRSVMEQVGGFRYCISQSINPTSEPYAGMAELYLPDRDAWQDYLDRIQPDGIEQWIDPATFLVLSARTEMIGIP